jgi:hypothetical protein
VGKKSAKWIERKAARHEARQNDPNIRAKTELAELIAETEARRKRMAEAKIVEAEDNPVRM